MIEAETFPEPENLGLQKADYLFVVPLSEEFCRFGERFGCHCCTILPASVIFLSLLKSRQDLAQYIKVFFRDALGILQQFVNFIH